MESGSKGVRLKLIGGGEGGGGRAKYQKIFVQGKIKWKKIRARQLTLKISMVLPKKNSYKEFDDENKFLRLENSPPPPPPYFF